MLNDRLRSSRMYAAWIAGLVRRRSGRLIATATGIALAVGLLASLGSFLSASKATMTRRAVDTVAVDWQVEAQSGADPARLAAVVAATPHVTGSEVVGLATASGFESTKAGTTRSTGPGEVLGVSDTYRATFPGQMRDLVGAGRGVLLFQQTAANLGAVPGDVISIGRDGLGSVPVTVDGVVDLPHADSLFQHVGAPAGSQPQAPPDNVLIVPSTLWHELFDPLAAARPDLVDVQIHVRLDRHLPAEVTTEGQDRPRTQRDPREDEGDSQAERPPVVGVRAEARCERRDRQCRTDTQPRGSNDDPLRPAILWQRRPAATS